MLCIADNIEISAVLSCKDFICRMNTSVDVTVLLTLEEALLKVTCNSSVAFGKHVDHVSPLFVRTQIECFMNIVCTKLLVLAKYI